MRPARAAAVGRRARNERHLIFGKYKLNLLIKSDYCPFLWLMGRDPARLSTFRHLFSVQFSKRPKIVRVLYITQTAYGQFVALFLEQKPGVSQKIKMPLDGLDMPV